MLPLPIVPSPVADSLYLSPGRRILLGPNQVLSTRELRPILDISKDIQSLTTFRRQSNQFLKQLKKSKRPVVLTVKREGEQSTMLRI
jgi:hypothetical protein